MIGKAIKNRKITLSIAVILVILGLFSYYVNPKQENPDINAPFAIITATYPGASPEDMERLVTREIEEEIAEIKGYSYSQSDSRNSFSITMIRLDSKADTKEAWAELRRRMDDLQKKLPEECSKIEINTDLDRTAGIILSLSSDKHTKEQLGWYAEELKKELVKINDISRIDIVGKLEKQINVKVDTSRLGLYNLSMEDVASIISLQNTEIPSGYIDDGETKLNVNMPGIYSSLEEIGNTVIGISADSGAVARLKHIASIYMEPREANLLARKDGRDAVLLVGYFKDNSNIIIVGRGIEKKIKDLERDLPEGMLLEPVLYQPEDVDRAVKDFSKNLILGVVFVIVIVFLGMGFRNALTVSAAIPLSIFVTFSIMRFLNIKIHQISIAALIIALGMLVDNAIVVTDAIQVRLDHGQARLDACVDGVKEVAIPVLTSTLTTVAAFIPLIMLPSVAGEYIRSIPQIVIISLSVSYMVALFVTPVIAYLFFKTNSNKGMLLRMQGWFGRALKVSLEKRFALVISVVAILLITIFIALSLGLSFFPKADTNMVYIDITAERKGDIKRTDSLVKAVEDIIKVQPEVLNYTSVTGSGLPKFYNTLSNYSPSEDFAQVMIRLDLKSGGRFKNNSRFVDYLQRALDNGLIGGTAVAKELEIGEPIGAPIRVRIMGDDSEDIKMVATKVKDKLRDIKGSINIDDDSATRDYEFYVDVDFDRAGNFGLSRYDIQREVNIALMGRRASVFREKGAEYDIIIKGDIKSKEDLENLRIKSLVTGESALLKEVSRVELKDVVPYIKKYDGGKAVMVTADVRDGFNSVDIERRLKKGLKGLNLRGTDIIFDGEGKKIGEYFGDIGVSAIFAVLLVYAILLVQFYSFTQPLVILFTIPFSIIGSIFGLWIFRQPLSFTALLGVVSLLGIVVNNAIVLLDYINNAKKRGNTAKEACIKAVGKRFRPIMLTTTTTVVGLIPLVVSGSELFRPMAIALISGLMVSTLLTLVVIPVVYTFTKA